LSNADKGAVGLIPALELASLTKVESERMLMRKPWDYAINLKEDFVSRKGRTYLMSRQEKEEV